MHPIESFGVDDVIGCSEAFSAMAKESSSMEEMAARITSYLHESIVDAAGEPACALVRLYKTHRYRDLDEELQAAARATGRDDVPGATRCLTLLGTAGREPAWNDRRRSRDHRAIPLISEAVVEQSPMIARLIRQLGLDLSWVVRADDQAILQKHHDDCDVFFVPDALASPFVPAQQTFVERYGIASVVGCGGVLPSGDMFALIIFTVVPVVERVADHFRSLALSVKAAIDPFSVNVFVPTS